MKNRKHFLAEMSLIGAVLAASHAASSQSAMPPPGPKTPPPKPPPPRTGAATKKPSEAALATARTMRRFDRRLTDAQIERIARDIDANAKEARALNEGGRTLHNWDEPVTTFRVPA